MKVVTILGTRPEIIRLSRILPKVDAVTDHVLVHTGQNWDAGLSDVFFDELEVRAPDRHLGIRSSRFGEQAGAILERCEEVLLEEEPDRLLLLGDTNSALSAIVAKRLGIAVYHLEAGNRCYDDRVPEEVNRRIIDHSSDVLLPYTERSRANLLAEGIEGRRIYVVGNPIAEVLNHFREPIDGSDVLGRLELEPGGYFLVTLHRQENVDLPERLADLFRSLHEISRDHELPVVVSVHPRTRDKLERFDVEVGPELRLCPPFGFFDFVALERRARAVLTDSGTVQEECAIFGVPNVTLRDVTERPETLECGSNLIAGADPEDVRRAVRTVLTTHRPWTAPSEYRVDNVSDRVVKILTSRRGP